MIVETLIGPLALLGRIVGLGLERPLVKALGRGRDSVAATTLYFGLGLISLLPIIVWQWASTPDFLSNWQSWILVALTSGVIYAVCFHSYVWALSVGEVSFLTPLYATAFIWLYALDLFFGDATLGLLPICGIIAVTLGIVVLNVEPKRSLREALNPANVLTQPGAWGMLVYAFGLATARLIDNSVSATAPALPYAFVANVPAVASGLVVLAFRRKLELIPLLQKERPWIAVIGAVSGMYAYVLLLVALDYYNPSVVEPVTQISVFIAVGLGIWWFKEAIKARWLAAILVVIGAALLLAG